MKRIVMLLTVAAIFAALMALNGVGAGTAFAVNTTNNQTHPPYGTSTGGTVHGSHGSTIERHGMSGKIITQGTCKVTGPTHSCP